MGGWPAVFCFDRRLKEAAGRACLPIADWYVLRGDWLWSGKGMMEAQTPRIIAGWTSQCV